MKSFAACMETYKKEMKKGDIQVAYSGLIAFILDLRNHLKNEHPEFYVSGNFYQGQLDFTYFPFTPVALKERKLRIAVVFMHKSMTFKVWLGGNNKKVQADYWEQFSEKGWDKYDVPSSVEGIDFIAQSVITADPDFADLPKLRDQLTTGIITFAHDAEAYISELEK